MIELFLDEIARSRGFDNANQIDNLLRRVNLSTPSVAQAFAEWDATDGTKAGLLRVLEFQRHAEPGENSEG